MMSDGGLIQRQKDIVGLQDDMIQEISFGLDRVHHQALNMGEEVTSQTKLLDGFNEDVELATAALQVDIIYFKIHLLALIILFSCLTSKCRLKHVILKR